MAFNSNILNIPLDGTGTEIPTLNVSDPYEKYLITGANTTIGNYAIVPSGTPQLGTTFLFKYKATTDITTNGNTFAIFGQALTQNQLLIELDIECYYTGSTWIVEVKPSLTTAFVEAVNIVASAVTTSAINNLAVTTGKINTNAVTNAKLAQMATLTVKANVTGGTADPSDVAISSLVALGGWGTTGNAGTTAGTNFIGTTDAVDLVFKVNNVDSGRLNVGNSNCSFGRQTLLSLTSGVDNTAFGTGSLQITDSGVGNTAVGLSSLSTNTSGSDNTGLGGNTLDSCSSGNNNTGVGSASLSTISTGSNNTALGASSGSPVLSTGNNNTIIGYNSDVSSSTSLNRICLGAGSLATADYQFAIPDDVTTIKFKGLTYTLPTALPGADAVLHCSSTGVLTWV